jgi:uncharacterized SAM-binding protein YcdF (DUF218 family)
LLARYRRVGHALAWFGVVLLFVLSLPIVSHALLRALDPPPPLDLARAREAQAVVILGGGVRPGPEFGGETLGRLTLERVRYGARVARATKLPVLVSGGTVYGGTAEAKLMKRALEEEFAVPVRWTEERSRDTRSNATESAAVLLSIGMKRIVLVAHGFDFPRASDEFAAAGFQVIPAPTVIAGKHFSWRSAVELLPSMSALQGSYYALYELLGGAVRLGRAPPTR